MIVGETTATFCAGRPPIVTVAPDWNPIPSMTTAVPGGPTAGATMVTIVDGPARRLG